MFTSRGDVGPLKHEVGRRAQRRLAMKVAGRKGMVQSRSRTMVGAVGAIVGPLVGRLEGRSVGEAVGPRVGAMVG